MGSCPCDLLTLVVLAWCNQERGALFAEPNESDEEQHQSLEEKKCIEPSKAVGFSTFALSPDQCFHDCTLCNSIQFRAPSALMGLGKEGAVW